ncbi:MAG: hypothetical protein WBC22_01305, partial [Sedimentisphaerales bacterium]
PSVYDFEEQQAIDVRSEKAPQLTTRTILASQLFWSRKFSGISKKGGHCSIVERISRCIYFINKSIWKYIHKVKFFVFSKKKEKSNVITAAQPSWS